MPTEIVPPAATVTSSVPLIEVLVVMVWPDVTDKLDISAPHGLRFQPLHGRREPRRRSPVGKDMFERGVVSIPATWAVATQDGAAAARM